GGCLIVWRGILPVKRRTRYASVRSGSVSQSTQPCRSHALGRANALAKARSALLEQLAQVRDRRVRAREVRREHERVVRKEAVAARRRSRKGRPVDEQSAAKHLRHAAWRRYRSRESAAG